MQIERADTNAGARLRRGLFAARPALYVSVILLAVLATYLYKLRVDGIFSCPANSYGSDWYLAYCNATAYGDYEHGSFWFGLEPGVRRFAADSKVLFLGSSRLQLALSTAATTDWFTATSIPYYLLGFGYTENDVFTGKLLRTLKPRAKVYVINVDEFFVTKPSVPAQSIMDHSATKMHYQMKRWWQFLHRPICRALPIACGDSYVIFRSRSTGAYRVSGLGHFTSHPVSYNDNPDWRAATSEASTAKVFLASLPVPRECVILTLIPYVGTNSATAQALGTALGMELVAPRLTSLRTFDGSHLDRASAERWSQAFLEAAGSRIRKCVAQRTASP
jgi:hypothetical protein